MKEQEGETCAESTVAGETSSRPETPCCLLSPLSAHGPCRNTGARRLSANTQAKVTHNLQCNVAPALKQNTCPCAAAGLVEVCSCSSGHLPLPGLQLERSLQCRVRQGERRSSPSGTWVLLRPHLRIVINCSGIADEESQPRLPVHDIITVVFTLMLSQGWH